MRSPIDAEPEDDWEHVNPAHVPYGERPTREDDIPHELGLYFGPQVGWDTIREGGSVPLELMVDGQSVFVRVCGVCYDGLLGEPLGHRIPCAGCLRYLNYEAKAGHLRSRYPKPEG